MPRFGRSVRPTPRSATAPNARARRQPRTWPCRRVTVHRHPFPTPLAPYALASTTTNLTSLTAVLRDWEHDARWGWSAVGHDHRAIGLEGQPWADSRKYRSAPRRDTSHLAPRDADRAAVAAPGRRSNRSGARLRHVEWRSSRSVVGESLRDDHTIHGVCALAFRISMYALEGRVASYTLAFAFGCVLSSVYGLLTGAWPFGVVELVWCAVAVRRWHARGRGN